ncbi:MAG: PadR family transcriptional regulator [Jatrophihabitans sp.]
MVRDPTTPSGRSPSCVTEDRLWPINATVGSLLGFLHDGPQSGWDLVTTAQQTIGDFWKPDPQPGLSRARLDGAGRPDRSRRSRPRDRRLYRLTDAGRQAFQTWLEQEPGQEQIRHPLLLTLAFAGHLHPTQVTEFLTRHRAIHAARHDAHRDQRAAAEAAGATPRDLITLDFGLRYETAVLDWFDHLPGDVAAPHHKPQADCRAGWASGHAWRSRPDPSTHSRTVEWWFIQASQTSLAQAYVATRATSGSPSSGTASIVSCPRDGGGLS